jgi:hypothetical protein
MASAVLPTRFKMSSAFILGAEKAGQSHHYWAEQLHMKLSLAILAVLCLNCVNLFAQGKIDLQTGDTMQSILQKNVGQTVELRLKAGEKIGGKVEKLGDKLVFLSGLSGAEFYDAAVEIADISAVVVRAKK